MRVIEDCAICLLDKQTARINSEIEFDEKDREAYIQGVRQIIDERQDSDTAPYLIYKFNQLHESMFGETDSYGAIKKNFNDLVMSMEGEVRARIEAAEDPLMESMLLARTGNYIDFGALDSVSTDEFLELLGGGGMSIGDIETYNSFVSQCVDAKSFLLITDNCGEIVLDKLMLEQLHARFPQLEVTILVRGGDVLNDANEHDAKYVGLDKMGHVVPNGAAAAGTIYELLSDEARALLHNSDVILSKGQGNYESLSGQGHHVFYTFLCKCKLFIDRFDVPKLTGMFIEANGEND